MKKFKYNVYSFVSDSVPEFLVRSGGRERKMGPRSGHLSSSSLSHHDCPVELSRDKEPLSSGQGLGRDTPDAVRFANVST